MQHILLVVSGMTPQIITETLYGIYRQDPATLPQRIVAITTMSGCQRIRDNLLGDDSPLVRLQQDYHLPPILFSDADIKVPVGDDGIPLDDVRSEREQEIIADFITRTVRELTADPDLALHASLAGGRKTMGFALGYAMSLFGRPQDRLSHVLVNAPYEDVPDFYYPTPTPVWRGDRLNRSQHDLSQAQVMLATIPLVLMRQEMPKDLMEKPDLSYTQTVERINKANTLTAETASVTLDYTHMSLNCDGYEVLLKPDCFAFYSWLAQDSKDNPGEGIEAPRDGMRRKELQQRLSDYFLGIHAPELAPHNAGHPLEELLELATDAIARNERQLRECEPHYQSRGNWLLQDNESNRSLWSESSDIPDELLLKRHKELWNRLLRETNKAITDALGERLASYYRLCTVNTEKGTNSRARFEFKGLAMAPEHIQLQS